jgi:hypothetical protein
MDLPEHAARNREVWNADAPNWVEPGRKAWASPTPWWGMWGIPEQEVNILADVKDFDVVDLGFLCNAVLAILCPPHGEEPASETLVRPQRGLHRIDWPHPDGTDFHQPHGERIDLLRKTGFEIEALHELYAPDGDPDEVRYYARRGWAQQWPGEEVWVARRTDAG